MNLKRNNFYLVLEAENIVHVTRYTDTNTHSHTHTKEQWLAGQWRSHLTGPIVRVNEQPRKQAISGRYVADLER